MRKTGVRFVDFTEQRIYFNADRFMVTCKTDLFYENSKSEKNYYNS